MHFSASVTLSLIIDSDCGYMFRLVLAILLPMNRDSGHMFRVVLTFL